MRAQISMHTHIDQERNDNPRAGYGSACCRSAARSPKLDIGFAVALVTVAMR
jgi:hypothetical protein